MPNETLITTTVLNHSYSSRETRVGIPVQVSYDSDVERALRLMEAAARSEPRVLHAPNGPAAFLIRFGPSGIELVNPGSVGMPFDGDARAAYALMRADGTIEHRRVTYDHEASAARVRDRFGAGWADVVARRIEQAAMVD